MLWKIYILYENHLPNWWHKVLHPNDCYHFIYITIYYFSVSKRNSSNIPKIGFLFNSIDRGTTSDYGIVKTSVNNSIPIKQMLDWINFLKLFQGSEINQKLTRSWEVFTQGKRLWHYWRTAKIYGSFLDLLSQVGQCY